MKMKNLYVVLLITAFMAACTDEQDTPGSGGPTDDRSRFTGSWLCTEAGSPTSFTITITTYGNEDSLYIDNFAGYGSSADALSLVSGSSITIPAQNISVTSIFVQGSGVLNSQGTHITLNYIADSDTISALCTKI